MDGLVTGLLVGLLAGMLIGPLVRSWIFWHEVATLRREGTLADDILARLDRADEDVVEPLDLITDGSN